MIARHSFTFASTVVALWALSGLLSAANAANASVFLEDQTWTELRDLVGAGTTTIIVPIGGTEQNGPAMALGKHNVRVRFLAEKIAGQLGVSMFQTVRPTAYRSSIPRL